MSRTVLLTALCLVAGCAGPKHLEVVCRGPLVVLNPTAWTPTAADVVALNALCPEDK